MSSSLLLRRAAAGDEDAFEAVYRHHAGLLRFLAGRFFAAGLDAGDLLQEARVGLWEAVRDYREGVNASSFASFARLCVERELSTAVKAALRQKHEPVNASDRFEREVEGGGVLGDAVPCRQLDPFERAVEAERTRDLFAAMARDLTELERVSVESVALAGSSYEEVAVERGVAVKAVDNAVQRARRKLAVTAGVRSRLRAEDLARHLAPLERSVYATALEVGSWDPADVAEALSGAARRLGFTATGQVRIAHGDEVPVADVEAAIGRVRATIRALLLRPPDPPRARRAGHPPRDSSILKNGVIPAPSYPASPERKEQAMSEQSSQADRQDETEVSVASRGFADRVREQAEAEAARVLADLERLRFDAHQVVRIMRALRMPVSTLLATVADATDATMVAPDAEGEEAPSPGLVGVGAVLPGAEYPRIAPTAPEGPVGASPAPAESAAAETPVEPEPAPEAPSDRRARILALVGEKPRSTGQVARAAGLANSTTTRLVNYLIARGELHRGADDLLYVGPASTQKAPPAARERKAPSPSGKRAEVLAEKQRRLDRIVEAVRGGVRKQGDLPAKTGIPMGSIGGLVKQLIADGRLARDGTDRLAGLVATGAEPAKPEPTAPAAEASAESKRERAMAENRAKVLAAVVEAGPEGAMLGDVMGATGLSQPPTSRYVQALIEEGLIGQPRGPRTPYVATGQQGAPATTGAPADVDDPAFFARVRDVVVGQTRDFTAKMVAEQMGAPEDAVRRCFPKLVERHVIENVGLKDFELYAYRPPTSPGRAAEIDAERARAAAASGAVGGAPVAGTGGSLKVSNPEVRALVRRAEKAGATVAMASNGHIAVTTPGGTRVLISHTPGGSAQRAVLNDTARLRRAGLAI